MVEILSFNRINVYSKSIIGSASGNSIKWESVRRLENLNCHFGTYDSLQCMSPSFKYFIRADLARKRFLVQDVLDEKFSYDIPEYLMSYKDSPLEMMNRFRWVGDGAIKVVNEEGIELLVDVATADFGHQAFNSLCNFNFKLNPMPMPPQSYYFPT